MLVLSRKKGEKIMIGDDIEIIVISSNEGRVRLGIIAPGMKIDREEVYLAKQEEKREEKK
jgi:carbon storage regulator